MEAPRTPSQWYALLVGAALVAAGVLALVTGSSNFGTVADGAGQNFVIWKVSGWETILYMGLGGLGLVAASRVGSARAYGLIAGLVFAAMAAWGFIDGNDVASIFSVDTTDNITYAVLGGLGLLLGLMPESTQRKAGLASSDRAGDRGGGHASHA